MTKSFTLSELQTLLAQLHLWLMGVAVWLAEHTPFVDARAVDADLKFARRAAGAVLVLMASKQALPLPPGAQPRPANAARGWRRPNWRGALRCHVRLIRAARTLRGRYEALREALDNVDALVARIRARLETIIVAPFVMTAAPQERVRALAGADIVARDSS